MVVAFFLLFFKVRLDAGLIREKYLLNNTVVGPLHDSVFTHERVSTAQSDYSLGSGLHRVVDLANGSVPILSYVGDASCFAIRSRFLQDVGSIGHYNELGVVDIVNHEHIVFSNLESGVSLRVYFGIDSKLAHLVRNDSVFVPSESPYSLRVGGLPDSSPAVESGDGAVVIVNGEVPIGKMPDNLTVGRDNSMGFHQGVVLFILCQVVSFDDVLRERFFSDDLLEGVSVWKDRDNEAFIEGEVEPCTL